MKMKRYLLAFVSAAVLSIASAGPAAAFIHVTMPGDDCAPPQAGEPGNNPAAHAAITAHNPQSLPLGNVTNAPTTCPAD